jgi:hypothetical protein
MVREDESGLVAGCGTDVSLLDLPRIAIHRAMTREQRLSALRTAQVAFNHKNTDIHSYEVDLGAVHALVLQLGYCLSSTEHDEEISLICKCLYQILSQCATLRKISLYQDLGVTELVPLLLQTGEHSWSVLPLLCRLPIAKSSLIAFPGFLEQVVKRLASPDESVVATVLGALKDLSFRTDERDRRILWEFDGLTEQLLAFIGAKLHNDDPWSKRHKESIATFWWNLALSIKEMQHEPRLLTALLQLLQDRCSAKIRQSSIAALGNFLSSESLSMNESFWNVLQHLALHEEDTACRRRVVRSLRCLLATTPKRPSVMYVLAQVAIHDQDTDIRLQALEGLRHLQPSAGLNCWTQAMVAIMEAGGELRVVWTACQMLPNDAEIVQPSENFWKAASQLIESIPESHSRVTQMMFSVVKNGGEDKLLQSPLALLILAQLLLTEQRPLELVQQLLECEKKRLAECDALLSSLVTICLSTTDNDEKDVAKSIILQLVPEL